MTRRRHGVWEGCRGRRTRLGLHYRDSNGVDYLIGDIFGLGTPIALVEDPSGRDEVVRAEIIAADDPVDQQSGVSVNTTDVKPGLQTGPRDPR